MEGEKELFERKWRGRIMIWTTEAPTKVGWYWFSEPDGSDERVVNVYPTGLDGTGPLAAHGEHFNLLDLRGHRWAGPI
jgi:hypothetical protein